MSATRPLSEILPPEMKDLRVKPLFMLMLDVQPPINVGNNLTVLGIGHRLPEGPIFQMFEVQ